jgi:AraC-like DNA-binding protein
MYTLPKLTDGSKRFENTPSINTRSMFYYVQSAGRYYCLPGFYEEHSAYNSFLILVTLDGKGSLYYRGKEYLLNKGQVVFISCLDKHCYSTFEKNVWETLWVNFNGSESRSYFEMIYKNYGPVINLNKVSDIPKNMDQILKMLEYKDLRLDIINSKILVDILTELLLDSLKVNTNEFEMPDTVKKAVAIIESSFNQPIDLDSLSREICISKFHLSKLFKKYTNFSPYEYLIKYRINYAKNLLKNTNIPIHAISLEIGFESVSHFIKIFHQYEETTPLKFRMQLRSPD